MEGLIVGVLSWTRLWCAPPTRCEARGVDLESRIGVWAAHRRPSGAGEASRAKEGLHDVGTRKSERRLVDSALCTTQVAKA